MSTIFRQILIKNMIKNIKFKKVIKNHPKSIKENLTSDKKKRLNIKDNWIS